jgi:arylsulfatase A-like enzyme
VKAGAIRRDPVLSLDITATALEIAGVPRPELFHGQSLLKARKPRTQIFTARDRCDMTVDRIRAVREDRFKLIRNFLPDRPYTQFNDYINRQYPTQQVIRELHEAGKLNPVQAQWMAPRRPEIEFYDLSTDPHEVRNLAGDPKLRNDQQRLEKALAAWIKETQDQGRTLESRETIDREEPRAKQAPRAAQAPR